jgi:hypothetical protein
MCGQAPTTSLSSDHHRIERLPQTLKPPSAVLPVRLFLWRQQVGHAQLEHASQKLRDVALHTHRIHQPAHLTKHIRVLIDASCVASDLAAGVRHDVAESERMSHQARTQTWQWRSPCNVHCTWTSLYITTYQYPRTSFTLGSVNVNTFVGFSVYPQTNTQSSNNQYGFYPVILCDDGKNRIIDREFFN